MTQDSTCQIVTPPPNRLIIGIDWADESHAVCVIDPQRQKPLHCTLDQQPEAIAAWAADLRQKYPGYELCVILEQSRGALCYGLLATGHFTLFPVNPKQLAKYRQALHPSGGKNDPGDAELLALFLLHYRDKLRPCLPDSEQTRQLAYLTEMRRNLVEERKRLTLQLASALKVYFPCLLKLFNCRLDAPLVTKVLQRWSSLPSLRKANPATLKTFFREHGVRLEERREALVAAIRSAVDLTTDKAILEPHAAYAETLARQIEVLVKAIEQFEADIAKIVAVHDDAFIFEALPGAGDVLVPRLIVSFGSDRERYQSALQVQEYTGIAPVMEQSGKSKIVKRRRACPKFLRQTFHEFADHSRRWSRWAKAWYDHKRASGMKHNAVVRALAFKWIRIIFQLWKNRERYSEERYIKALITANSPIANLLKS